MGKLKAFLLLLLLSGIALPARAQDSTLPDRAYISGVNGYPQSYTLSCESRSAVDWAAYWGVDISETQFLERLPRSDNPNQGFVGNPNEPWGYIPPASYGVHAKPVARLLRDYGLDAHAGTGVSWDELRSEIAGGRPVIVWVIGSIWRGTPREYETRSGNVIRVANNEHTMILVGYDQTSVQLVDALTGYTLTHSIENFLTSWSVLGNMAILGAGSGDRQNEPETSASQDAYTVQRGDTLSKLGTRWGIAWQDLAAWNQISYPYLIFPGQTLTLSGQQLVTVPATNSNASNYTVQRGDHLMKIARELELDWHILAELNHLEPPYLLYPGNVLALPNGADEGRDEGADPEVPEVYTAVHHESLFALANYYRMDWIRLAAINNLNFPYLLTPGEAIRLR